MFLKKIIGSLLLLSSTTYCFNADVLTKLIERYDSSESDALRIEIHGQPVLELGGEVIYETMSITKSVVSLAIGILVDEGKIPSIDEPVATYYPQWADDGKKEITIRHVLSHTSGLKGFSSVEETLFTLDFIESALEADRLHPPGTKCLYNNRVVNILSGIVEQVSGQRLDLFVEEKIFTPLGIDNFFWKLDFEGNALSMYGLELTAEDLCKIGQLVLNHGTYNGQRVVSEAWLKEALEPSQTLNQNYGLLWLLEREELGVWPEALLEQYEAAGIDHEYIEILRELQGKPFPCTSSQLSTLFGSYEVYQAFVDMVKQAGLEPWVVQHGAIVGYKAHGYLGQFLVIIPEKDVIAVRQIEHGKKPDDAVDEFLDFVSLINQLVE